MAQHAQPRHLGNQTGGEQSKSGAAERTSPASRETHEQKTASDPFLSLESEFLFDDWDPFADVSIHPDRAPVKKTASERPAAKTPEAQTPAEQRASTQQETSTEQRVPTQKSVPTGRRVSTQQSASTERRASTQQSASTERRPSTQQDVSSGRRTTADQPRVAAERRTAADQPPAERRAFSQQGTAADRRPAQGQRPPAERQTQARAPVERQTPQPRREGPVRRPAPEGYDDYIDTRDTSPGKGCLAAVAVLKVLISLIFVVMMAGFCYFLYNTGMLPDIYFLVACAALGVLAVVVLCLIWLSRKSGLLYTGVILALVCTAGITLGTRTLGQAVDTIQDITDTHTVVSQVSVYVLQDDGAQALNDLGGYACGMVEAMGREAVDETVNRLNASLETPVRTLAFPNMAGVVDALRSGSVQAIIVGEAQLDALEETDGYETIGDELRTVTEMRIERTVEEEAPADSVPLDEVMPFAVYISGIDSREGLIAESRSDVNIIALVNPETHQVLLVTTPRDYYVPLSISNGMPDKLTHAGMYGVNVSIDTLEMLYDIDIDYYFRLSFDGFEKIIDALGGVTVNSDVSFWDYTNTYYFAEGPNELNGAQALAFARERKALEDGDRGRGRHQMALIKAVAEKVLSTDLLRHYSDVLNAVSGSFETNVPYELVAKLVQQQLSDGASWQIERYSVTGTDNWEAVCYSLPGTRYVLEPDQASVDTAKSLMTGLLAGEKIEVPTD